MVSERLARIKVAFTTLSTAVLAKEKEKYAEKETISKDIADSFSHALATYRDNDVNSRCHATTFTLSLADGNFEIFSFSAYFSSSFLF